MGPILLNLVLHAAIPALLAHAPVRVLGIEGQPVFLKVNVPPDFLVRDALWRFLTPAEELVAISFKGTAQNVYRSRFYGRSRLHTNFSLEISPAALEDSGIFSALLVNTMGEIEKQIFHLEVYDVVSTPTIHLFGEESNRNRKSGSCEFFLACAASRGTNVTYSWAGPGGETLAGENHSALENGQVLRAKLDLSEKVASNYTCTVANAVSAKSVSIEVQEQCQRQSGVKVTAYDYRDILLIMVPLACFLLSAAVILHAKCRSGKQISYVVAANEPFPA